MKQVFISYARENAQQVGGLAADIADLGHQAWFDQALTGGQAWWDQILVRIRDCDTFVFALSPESLESQACDCEWRYAHALSKSILPVLIRGDISGDLLPPYLADLQYLDYRQADKAALTRLMKAFGALPASPPLPDPLPAPPAAPKSYLGSLREQVQASRTLSFQEQSALLVTMKQGLRDEKNREETYKLLGLLRLRPDLLARVADEVDELVKGRASGRLTDTVPQPQPASAGATPAPAPAYPASSLDNTSVSHVEATPFSAAPSVGEDQSPLPGESAQTAAETTSFAAKAMIDSNAATTTHPSGEPKARHLRWGWLAAALVAIAVIIFVALPASVDGVYIPGSSKTLRVGEKVEIYPELRYDSDWRRGREYVGQTSFQWRSSNDAVATVGLGTVTGVSPGTAVITARFDDHADAITVTVLPMWDVPAMKATFKEVKFFAAEKIPEPKDRHYRTEFDSKLDKTIMAEFTLGINQSAADAADRALSAPFNYVLYYQDNRVAEDYAFTIKVDRTWGGVISPQLLYFKMEPGKYRIDLKHDNKVIGSGAFILK